MRARTTNARRKINNREAQRIETQRTRFEGMGLDCKFAIALVKNGVTEKELLFLAKKDIPTFLKKAEHKLTPEQKRYLNEKY